MMTRGRFWSVFLALVLVRGMAVAQVAGPDTIRVVYPDDTVAVRLHSTDPADPTLQSLWEADVAPTLSKAQTKGKEKRQRRDWSQWRPEAKRAMWLALVLPGAGQVYNRKYWKLPIIYGGFAGCIYAMTWNNQMYHDYSQAYLDIMDDDPTTESYKNFLHLGTEINESNLARYQEIFRKRKNRYRRWRDLSVFATIAVYALSVIDAYVGNDGVMTTRRSPFGQNAIGLGCSLRF